MREPEEKLLLRKPIRRWEDGSKMDLREIERGDMDWIIRQ
jgi:hypothetical protein